MTKELLLRYLRNELTGSDEADLRNWLAASEANRQLLRDLEDPNELAQAFSDLDNLHPEQVWEAIQTRRQPRVPAGLPAEGPAPRIPRHTRRWIAAAAAILLLLGAALWLLRQQPKPTSAPTAQQQDIPAPATHRATLTLADGHHIDLDSAATGRIALQGSSRVLKTDSGQLSYQSTKQPANLPPSYNTLTTPRGGQYRLLLPDGTKVWLNAASSITYPTAFTGRERNITLTGEAYLEVAANSRQPFILQTGKLSIEVLGTSFNVNAYTDEPNITTTLAEGRIRLRHAQEETTLKPGEQASLPVSGGPIRVTPDADLAAALAWKNGLFAFQDADIPTLMRQLARWYNIDVQYEGTIPKRSFNGKIGRGLTLEQVLTGLTQSRIHYTIEPGRKLIIRP